MLLVRLGGYAAGVFAGSPPELVTSKTGSRPVHGRSAAGGWSQHRFARRREKQAAEALDAAAGAAVRVFGAFPAELDAVVLGGDRRTAAGLRDEPRLRPYLALATERFLTVPDPRLPVLRDSPRLFRAIRIRVTEPRPLLRRSCNHGGASVVAPVTTTAPRGHWTRAGAPAPRPARPRRATRARHRDGTFAWRLATAMAPSRWMRPPFPPARHKNKGSGAGIGVR